MLSALQVSLLRAGGPVDIDGTILVQLGIFVVFAVLLNVLVIKPLMAAQQTRYSRMEGARKDATSMDQRTADASADYEAKITAARQGAVSIRDDIRSEAESKASEMVTSVRQTTQETLSGELASLRDSADKTRAGLEAEAESIAAQIAERLLSDGGSA